MQSEVDPVMVVTCRSSGFAEKFGQYFWISSVVINSGPNKSIVHFNGLLDPEKIAWSSPDCKNRMLYVIERCCKFGDTDMRRPVIFDSYISLLTAFWEFYLKHGRLVWLLTDYRMPRGDLKFYELLETNPEWLFAECISQDPKKREIHHPSGFCDQIGGFIELSTMMAVRGYSPVYEREFFVIRFDCSLYPKDWHDEPKDPMQQAMASLSVYQFIVKTKK